MLFSTSINVTLLCLLNTSLMVGGFFLNSVVITSVRKSSQLRRKLCYFMIIVLSCFDLAAVVVIHPVLIISTIMWSTNSYGPEMDKIFRRICMPFQGFSMFALLTLSAERFFALNYPYYHQTVVTKRRLFFFLASVIAIFVAVLPLIHLITIFRDIIIAVSVLLLLVMLVYFNYKMFMIAKSKQNSTAPSSSAVTSNDTERQKRSTTKFRTVSTCSLAVACFFICFSPQIVFRILLLITKINFSDQQLRLFALWLNTVMATNSTFNCLIFFWRNSVLRREGMKILKGLKS